MTPKEKAENIWMKFFQRQIEITGNGDGNLCVEMALIAVNEILESFIITIPKHQTEFWEEVKQEIINL
jgi:hypothetical protein